MKDEDKTKAQLLAELREARQRLSDLESPESNLETLRDSDLLFRTIFETSPDPININRMEDGKFIKVNDKFLELTGFGENEVLGKTSHDINIWQSKDKRKQFLSQPKQLVFYCLHFPVSIPVY